MQDRLGVDNLFDVGQKPGVDCREAGNLLHRHAPAQRLRHIPQAIGVWNRQLLAQGPRSAIFGTPVLGRRFKSVMAGFERTEGLLQRFLERTPDGHSLSHRLHLRRQRRIRAGEFFKGEARHLDDAVVNGRFKGGRGDPSYVVGNFVQRITHGQLGGDFGNRETGRFRGQRRTSRHTRVHFDDLHFAVFGIHGELDIRTPRFNADSADDADGRVPHRLVFLVAQCLRRRHGDTVAGVHTHGVDVLYRTDNDHVVGEIPHHLQLVFLPPENRLLDQHLLMWTGLQAARHEFLEFAAVVGHAASGTAERE